MLKWGSAGDSPARKIEKYFIKSEYDIQKKVVKFSKRNDDHSNPNHEHRYEDPNGYGEDLFGGCS